MPSFYVLDVMRAIIGQIPHHEELQREAALAGGAKLDWPAPAQAARRSTRSSTTSRPSRRSSTSPDRAAVRGQAHYLLGLNPALRRSVTRRWARARSRWLAAGRTGARDTGDQADARQHSGSARARTRFRRFRSSRPVRISSCSSAIYRFAPNDPPEPLQRLDPLTRGSLFHEVQACVLRTLQADGSLPLTADGVPNALQALDAALDRDRVGL